MVGRSIGWLVVASPASLGIGSDLAVLLRVARGWFRVSFGLPDPEGGLGFAWG